MRGRYPIIALIVLGLALVGVVIFIVARGGAPEPADVEAPDNVIADDPEAPDASEQTQVRVSGTELTVRDAEGEILWLASFEGEIELDADNRVANATDVEWHFEGEGFDELSLKAPVMRAAWDERRLLFSDGVVIEAEEGNLQFSANSAEYQFDTRKVIGRGDVCFVRGSFAGRVQEVVIDNRAKVIRLKRGELARHQ